MASDWVLDATNAILACLDKYEGLRLHHVGATAIADIIRSHAPEIDVDAVAKTNSKPRYWV